MKIAAGAATDTGPVRSNNEDGYLVLGPIFAVADGMGGQNAGEVASGLAIDTLQELIRRGATAEQLPQMAREANARIVHEAASSPRQAGMGTTLTAIGAGERTLHLAHIGDSRAYLLRQGVLQRLTEDHTWVQKMVRDGALSEEQAAKHPDRNMLSRALGMKEDVEIDGGAVEARNGDRLLLCTDGLSSFVHDADIQRILSEGADPSRTAEVLVAAAISAGSHDNVTAVVVDVRHVTGGGADGLQPGRGAHAAPRRTFLSRAMAGFGSTRPGKVVPRAARPPAEPADDPQRSLDEE